MYNDNLKLAVEYNGAQHYKYVKYYYKTEEQFHKRLRDDKLKISKCEENNILLIIVPYTIDNNDICKFIFDESIKLGLHPKNEPKQFNLLELRAKANSILEKKVRDYVSSYEGTIINGNFLYVNSELCLQCKHSHEWITSIKNLLEKITWCDICLNQTEENEIKNIIETRELYIPGKNNEPHTLSQKLKIFNATDKGKEIKKKAHEKRSISMDIKAKEKFMNTKVKFCADCNEDRPVCEFKVKEIGKSYETYCIKHSAIRRKEKKVEKKNETEKDNVTFSCPYCDKVYAKKDSLTRHIKDKH